MTNDWANWDDTYVYAIDRNQSYEVANLMDATFVSTETNLLLILDNDNKVIFGKAYDLNEEKEILIPPEINDYLARGLLTEHDSPESVISGLIPTADYPVLLVSKPILTSNGDGPTVGTFIFGVFMNEELVRSLSATTHLDLSVYYLESPDLPEDLREADRETQGSVTSFVKPLNRDRIAGYAKLIDISGGPSVILRAEMSRDIYHQGLNSVRLLHSMLLGLGIIFCVLFVFILKRIVLSRVINLDKSVIQIARTGDRSRRVKAAGRDELSSLSNNINIMLDHLEKADKEIKALYEEEKGQREELEEEARTRTKFISILAHELRTPLTPILVSVEALKSQLEANPKSIEFKLVSNAFNGAQSLSKRLEDLLELARFSRGAFKLNLFEIETGRFLTDTATQFSPSFEPKHQHLVIDIPNGMPPVKGDSFHLEQVLLNLLSNANKYSPEDAEIKLMARVVDHHVEVEIKDDGIGIAPEDQADLFKPYHRVQQDRQSFPGIGLGLAVCKQIIEAHGGKIWVESEFQKGSSFKFTVPLWDVRN
jgi:signal transduction histidine kinase